MTSSSFATCPWRPRSRWRVRSSTSSARSSATARIVVVPGNHDHHFLDEWLERRRLDGAAPLGLEQRMPVEGGPLAEVDEGDGTGAGGARLPRRVAAAGRLRHSRPLPRPPPHRPELRAARGRRGRARTRRLPGGDRRRARRDGDPGSASPDDYERIQAPLYAFLFTLAQSGSPKERLGGANPSARVWQAVGGGYGRAARIRGRLLGTRRAPRRGRGGEPPRARAGEVRPLARSDQPRRARRHGRGGAPARHRGRPRDLRAHASPRTDARRRSDGASKTAPACGTPAAGSTRRGCSAARRPTAPTGPGRSSSSRTAAIQRPSISSRIATRRSCAEAIDLRAPVRSRGLRRRS